MTNDPLRISYMLKRWLPTVLLVFGCSSTIDAQEQAEEHKVFDTIRQFCVRCHGAEQLTEGDVDLASISSFAQLESDPELLKTLLDVMESQAMPPEGEPVPSESQRGEILRALQDSWQNALETHREFPRTSMRRMNRFQYNNAVQDLLKLKVVVYPLPERLMREHGAYFQPETGVMPETVRVGNRPLGKSQLIEPKLGDVVAFPQDLRADQGYDNQADHLSLSPMLLESFLTLSHSIVESKDFNSKNCGIWTEFFAPPVNQRNDNGNDEELERIVRKRLQPFLTRAFRRPVDPVTLDRYTDFVMGNLREGQSFTECMKSVTGAVLASPKFFYIYDTINDPAEDTPRLDDFDLATRLSLFLWGSIPDDELLKLAAWGRLKQPDILAAQVERMLNDRKLKRFCDSFPGQWLQLDRLISSTPDPGEFPQFYFLKYRASMHMMLEPLLLFETVLIENRSIVELIDPDFSYRSDLLDAWYQNGEQGKPGSPVVVAFHRVNLNDRRQGGVITNAAVMTMTSGPAESKPITRGAWVAGVVLNDPPDPPPANVPPLTQNDPKGQQPLTLRERFAAHRSRPDCASCHRDIDPLGFALENYDAAGIWRETYADGQPIHAGGVLFGQLPFDDLVEFKDALTSKPERFAKAFAAHLLRFALGRPIGIEDQSSLDQIEQRTAADGYRLRDLIKSVVLSESFRY